MTAADEARINAMATARSIKALLIYLDITTMIGHPATEADIKSMNHHGKDAAVRSAGVKVASEGTWKVVQAIAARFGGPNGRGAVDVALDAGAEKPVVLPDGCIDGHSPGLMSCEYGSDWL